MTKSDKKYGDPTAVLRCLTDNNGRPVEIGNEQDIGEFNDTLLSRVQEGLNFRKLYEEARKLATMEGEDQKMSDVEEKKESKEPLDKLNSSIMVDETTLLTDVEPKDQDMQDEEGVETLFKDDIITTNFKGRIRQMITFKGQDGTEKVKETVIDSFAAILVRVVGFKDLYEAWEQQYQSTIEDFRENDTILSTGGNLVPGSSETQAVQTEWIEQVPKVLCL